MKAGSNSSLGDNRILSDALNLNVPSILHSFSRLFENRLKIAPSDAHENAFLGVSSHNPQESKSRLKGVFSMAKFLYQQEGIENQVEPSQKARFRTQKAAVKFYQLAYRYINKSKDEGNFPLYGKNKCIGFVSIPRSKIVIIAISQDRVPDKDIELRLNMVKLIQAINSSNSTYQYRLACLPTKEQYFLLRALSAPISHDGDIVEQIIDKRFDTREYEKLRISKMRHSHALGKVSLSRSDTDIRVTRYTPFSECGSLIHGIEPDLIEYRTRCVEVALMVALNKCGRTISFKPNEISMEAFSGGLWEEPITKDMILDKSLIILNSETLGQGVPKFLGEKRNAKYTVEPSIPVSLMGGGTGYLDYWGPCHLHCQQMLKNMRVISNAGGAGSSFAGPIFEGELVADEPQKKTRMSSIG